MRKNCKDNLIAEAHRNPEYAAMPAKKLATIIDADQTTISKWRRRMKDIVAAPKRSRIMQPKVTVDSVRRKWEEKYAHLNRQYEALADRLVEMARNADMHRNKQHELESELEEANDSVEMMCSVIRDKNVLIDKLKEEITKLESRSWIQRLFSSKA